MRVRRRDLVQKFFADRGTHLAAMIAYFALLSFVPLTFLSLSAPRPDRPRRRVLVPRQGHQERRSPARRSTRSSTLVHAVQDNAAALGDRRRRRAALDLPLALQRARVGVQHRLRPAEPLVPAREGARRPTDGRLTGRRCSSRCSPARSASQRCRRYAPGFVVNQRLALRALDRGLAVRRLRLPRVVLLRPDERRRDAARGAAGRNARDRSSLRRPSRCCRSSCAMRISTRGCGVRCAGLLLVWLYVMANVIVLRRGAELVARAPDASSGSSEG